MLLVLQPEPLEKKSLDLSPTQNWLLCGYPVNHLDQYNQICNVICIIQRYPPSFAPFLLTVGMQSTELALASYKGTCYFLLPSPISMIYQGSR